MSKPEARYLPALDGLRAVAVAAVLAFHLGRLRGGFFGVDVFFVISGFLITRLLLAEWERTGTISLRAFWVRRFRRLVPALLLVLAAVALGSRAWLPGWRLGDIRDDALGALAYVANWRFVSSGQSYFASGIGPSPLRHTWSLAIEEQFYVVWPLAVLGSIALAVRLRYDVRRVVNLVAGGLALASAGWMAWSAGRAGTDLTRTYYGTDTRAFAILAGAWLASWWEPSLERTRTEAGRTGHRLLAEQWAFAAFGGVAALAVLAATTSEDVITSYQGSFQLVAVLSVVTVAGLATGEGPLAAALSHPVLLWIGRRSYGIYLWSWPTQIFAAEQFGLDGLGLDAVVVGVAVGLAAVSYRFVEAPVLARGRAGSRPLSPDAARREARPRRWAGQPSRGLATASLSVAAVLALVVGTAAGAPAKPALLSVSDDEAQSVALRKGTSFTTTPGEATSTTRVAPSTTVVPGDVGVPGDPADDGPPLPPGPFAATGSVGVGAPAPDATSVFGRPLRIMIAGDSVGWSIAWGASTGDITPTVQVSNRAIIGCGILPADTVRVPVSAEPEPYPATCASAPEAQQLGIAEHPDVALVWVGAWEVFDQRVGTTDYRVGSRAYARLLEERLQWLVDQFRAAGVPTVLPIVPCFGPSPVYPVERLDQDRIAWVNARIRAVAGRNRGWVRTIDPTSVLCTAEGTVQQRTPDGIEIRPDGAHFESDSAVWFWNTWLAGEVAGAFTDRS